MMNRKLGSILLSIFLICVFVRSVAALDKSSIVAYWPLDGDVKDATGNGSDGEIIGDPQWEEGKFGQALLFDGQDDYVNIADDEDQNKILDLDKGLTLMAWVRLEAETGGNPNFVAKDHAYFLGYLTGAKALRHGVHTAGWSVQVASEAIEEKVWTHVCLTHDGKTMIYYKDGKKTDEFGVPGDINKEDSNLTIGTFQKVETKAISQIFNGRVDEVAIFDTPLDSGDIKLLMDAGVEKAMAVDSKGKLATSWGEIKTAF